MLVEIIAQLFAETGSDPKSGIILCDVGRSFDDKPFRIRLDVRGAAATGCCVAVGIAMGT
jgi:hypothetical protein